MLAYGKLCTISNGMLVDERMQSVSGPFDACCLTQTPKAAALCLYCRRAEVNICAFYGPQQLFNALPIYQYSKWQFEWSGSERHPA